MKKHFKNNWFAEYSNNGIWVLIDKNGYVVQTGFLNSLIRKYSLIQISVS